MFLCILILGVLCGSVWKTFLGSAHRVDVRALVFGAIAGVAEGFLTAGMLAHVGFLTCVTPQMDFEVLQTRERFLAALKLNRNVSI